MNRLTCLVALIAAASAPAAQDTWTIVPSGTTQDLRAVHFVNADVGYAAGAGGTVRRTIDGGLTWNDASPDSTQDLYDVHFFNLETGVVVGDGGMIFRTNNAGVDWTAVASGVEVGLQSVSFSGNVGIAGGGSQTILRSEDAGASWTVVQTDFFGGGFPGAHMLDATNGFVAGTNSIFQPLVGSSDDGGATFDFVAFYLNTNEGNLRDVHFLAPTTGVVVGVTWDGQGAISRTVNTGADWTTTLFAEMVEAVDFASSTHGLAIGQAGGSRASIDGGVSWTPSPPISSAELYDVDLLSPTLGFVVGSGGTIMRGTQSTASAPPADDAAFSLEVGPNPLAGVASVRFRLPAASDATLTVFDALGRVVLNAMSEWREAGTHSMAWDASGLPAGTYLLVLEADGRRASRVISVR